MWSKDIKYEIRLIQKAPPKQPKERSGGRPSYAKGASKGSIHGRVRGYAKESICDLTERSGQRHGGRLCIGLRNNKDQKR